VRFADPTRDAGAPDDAEAIRLAEQALGAFRLADDVDLVADTVRRTWEAGAGVDGGRVDPRASETHVVFQQVVDGVPIVTPGEGEIRVTVDGTGSVCAIADATRRVEDVDVAPRPPEPASRASRTPRPGPSDADALLAPARERLLRRLATSGPTPTWSRAVEDSTEVGYVVRDERATPAARQILEVDCGVGLAKRFALEAPIVP
jgi:hypothetical protein